MRLSTTSQIMNKLMVFLRRNWLLLCLCLVILISIAFNLDRLSSGHKNIQVLDTPLVIKSIKEVNQLVSAEYYGEVIADLREVYQNLEAAFYTIKHNDSSGMQQVLLIDSIDYSLLAYLIGTDSVNAFCKSHEWSGISQLYKWKSVVLRERKQLVYIGRGWVKAGFDLSADNVEAEYSSADSKFILSLSPPIILYADINPWFSQEEGIEGFEIFIGKNEKYISDLEVKAVKHLCKQKLLKAAHERALLKKAEISGVEMLTKLLIIFGVSNPAVIIKLPQEAH